MFVVAADEPKTSSPLIPCTVRDGIATDLPTYLKGTFDLALLRGPVPQTDSRQEHELLTLLRAAAALSSIRGLAGLDAALAGLILDAIPVRRVALADGDDRTATVRSAWSATASRPGDDGRCRAPCDGDTRALRLVVNMEVFTRSPRR